MSTLTLAKPIKKALGKLSIMDTYNKNRKDLIKFIVDYPMLDESAKELVINTMYTVIFKNNKYKERNSPLDNPNIINYFTRYNGESWTTVFIISATSKHHAGVIASQYINIDGYSFNSPYDCTGKPFTYEAEYIKLDSNKWAITQRGSIDV
jgi:hypothetical protein